MGYRHGSVSLGCRMDFTSHRVGGPRVPSHATSPRMIRAMLNSRAMLLRNINMAPDVPSL